MTESSQRICDYENSTYRQDFWEGRGRDYEDTVERRVLKQLLPESGKRLLEVGAGFGRLSREYRAYQHVVLLDYSFSQLQYAREMLGDDGYTFVAADAYKLPFKTGVFDGATMIRVLHHFENAPAVLGGIQSVLNPNATFILEFANKHNLKAMLRYRLNRQDWNPDTLEPVEFVNLNFNFHPEYIQQTLTDVGFKTDRVIPVSFFRVGALKRLIPAGVLASLDGIAQKTGWQISPSVFTKNHVINQTVDQIAVTDDDIFACPLTGGVLRRDGDTMVNQQGVRWAITDGIYNFKEPLS